MTDLTLTYRGTVHPWHCDQMGHMNVMYYVGKFDEGTWHLFRELGLTPGYMSDHHAGMAAVQQNITYKRELHAGDTVTVRSGVLEVGAKTLKFVHEMRNDLTGEVAAFVIMTATHMDTKARKSTPLPEAIAKRAKARVVQYPNLSTPR